MGYYPVKRRLQPDFNAKLSQPVVSAYLHRLNETLRKSAVFCHSEASKQILVGIVRDRNRDDEGARRIGQLGYTPGAQTKPPGPVDPPAAQRAEFCRSNQFTYRFHTSPTVQFHSALREETGLGTGSVVVGAGGKPYVPDMSQRYDYVMAGGGAAGLSLAYHLVQAGHTDKQILIIDLEEKRNNDRTWCFWIDRPFLFDPIVHRRWSHIWFHGPHRSHRFALNPYEYRMIRGEDFYRYTREALVASANVTFLNAAVTEIVDGDVAAGTPAQVVLSSGETVEAEWVFDSLFLPRDFVVDEARYRFLKQHFVGWTIRTAEASFDPAAATMFDLRIEQNGAFRFMYILPFSEREALVEYTFFSTDLLDRETYEAGIRSYIETYLPGVSYEIVEDESGIIPMTDQPFPRHGGQRIMRTGTKGGRVKASTGFAFLRTQRDSERIVRSLEKHGHPFAVPAPPRRYGTFDAMLLSILDRTPDRGRDIFVKLFEKNPLPRIWRFLDEDAGLVENLKLMASVPWGPFIAAWFDVRLRRMRRQKGE